MAVSEDIAQPLTSTSSSEKRPSATGDIRTLSDLAVAISFSTLIYTKAWIDLLAGSANNQYLMKSPPGSLHYLATLLDIGLLAAALTGIVRWARHQTNPRWMQVVRLAFLADLVVLFNATRDVLLRPIVLRYKALSWSLRGNWPAEALFALLLLGLGYLLWRCNFARLAAIILLVLSPFGALKIGQLLWRCATRPPTGFDDRAWARRFPISAGQKRVVWVIFDEWDQYLTFENPSFRPRLPELSRIRQEGFYADHAISPAGETQYSLPSLINGRVVRTAEASGPGELQLTYAGADTAVPWSREPTIFSSARSMGLNPAIVGWAHPYCRLFGDSTAFCHWTEVGMQYNSMGSTLPEIFANQSRALFETFQLSPFGQTLGTRQHKNVYVESMEWAERAAADPGLSMIMLHLPIPHPPFFYDRIRRDHSLRQSPVTGYYDSLELVDRSVGELRSTLEGAGLWDDTSLVLSADHPCRFSDQLIGRKTEYIPFLVKLAGNSQPIHYSRQFNTVLTKDLILTMLAKPHFSYQDLAEWITCRTLPGGRTAPGCPYTSRH
jgi:hypothetical protein